MKRPAGTGRLTASRHDTVNNLAAAVLILMLLYAIMGIPDLHRDATETVDTDAVNPLNRFIWLGLLAATAPVLLRRLQPTWRLAKASWPLLGLYCYFAVSASWALDPGASARRAMFSIVQLLLSLTLLSGLRRAATLHMLIFAACTTAAIADLIAWVLMPGYAMTDEGFAGLQLQKNQTGLLMMYGCLSGGTAFFLLSSRLLKTFIAGAVLIMMALLVATRSTTSQSIVLLAPIVVPGLLFLARRRRSTIWAVALGFPTAVLVVAMAYLALCGLTAADPWAPMRGVTFTSRTDLWSFVLSEIAKRPWFGAGYSSLWAIDPSVQPSLKSDMWFGTYAIINEGHEGYLDLLATGGIIGFSGALLVVFRAFALAFRAAVVAEPARTAWQTGEMAYPTAAFHLSLLLALVVHNFTESNLFSNNSLLAVAFMLAALDLEKWRLNQHRRSLSASVPRAGRLPSEIAIGAEPGRP